MQGMLYKYLVLMAIISINQPSGKNVIVPEHDKEIAQRMKEREVNLREHQLYWEKEIADLEAREKSLLWPLWKLERKIRGHTGAVFGSLVPAVFMIWRQRRNGARGEHGEEEPHLGLLGTVWKGVAFLTKPCVLFRVVCLCMRGTVAYLPLLADGLVELPLKLVRSRKKNLGLA